MYYFLIFEVYLFGINIIESALFATTLLLLLAHFIVSSAIVETSPVSLNPLRSFMKKCELLIALGFLLLMLTLFLFNTNLL